MKTKKILQLLPLFIVMTITLPAFSRSTIKGFPEITKPVNEADIKARQILARLNEIKKMDKSELTRVEKKNLRIEVKGMKKEMKAISGGVYLSVAAIIIIILVLILIL